MKKQLSTCLQFSNNTIWSIVRASVASTSTSKSSCNRTAEVVHIKRNPSISRTFLRSTAADSNQFEPSRKRQFYLIWFCMALITVIDEQCSLHKMDEISCVSATSCCLMFLVSKWIIHMRVTCSNHRQQFRAPLWGQCFFCNNFLTAPLNMDTWHGVCATLDTLEIFRQSASEMLTPATQ